MRLIISRLKFDSSARLQVATKYANTRWTVLSKKFILCSLGEIAMSKHGNNYVDCEFVVVELGGCVVIAVKKGLLTHSTLCLKTNKTFSGEEARTLVYGR